MPFKVGDIVRVIALPQDLPHPQCLYAGQLGKVVRVDNWYHVATTGAFLGDAVNGVPFERGELEEVRSFEFWIDGKQRKCNARNDRDVNKWFGGRISGLQRIDSDVSLFFIDD